MFYGDKITLNGSLSIISKFDMRACNDGFEYFIKESDFNNIICYFRTLITSHGFDTKIDNIQFPYNSNILDYFIIKTNEIVSVSEVMDLVTKKYIVKLVVAGAKNQSGEF